MADLGKAVMGLMVCSDQRNPAGYRFTDESECPYFSKKGEAPGCVTMLIRDALELLKAHSWISVKDKLPKEGKDVLVWNDYGFCYVDEIENGKWRNPGGYSGNTHWMPLPKPPKEET